ncbi:hypothetical protein EZV62_015251 [Acer yangbiense]|uniref:Uncharacterized protein n=1 Tax=Acer yangbiense TaxID=1000413 RepID=A0A5C7HV09_9ROSI|nr:hypothetical protein EZV62_015251 [Acer yangbiense]
MNFLDEYKTLQVPLPASISLTTAPRPKWYPPLPGTLKLNVDVGLGVDRMVGVRAMIRDHFGFVYTVIALFHVGCFDFDVGEVFTICEALVVL